MKLLIFTASTGNGHTAAANAIDAEAKARGIHSEVVDVMDHCPRAFRRWFKGGYEMLVRRSPKSWGHLYRTSDRPLGNYLVQTGLDVFSTYPIDNLIEAEKPDWIVCTHSVIQPRLRPLRQRYGFKVAVVVTDLYPHRMWLRGRPDFYFVPGEWTKKILSRRIPWSVGKVQVTGIPIGKPFAEPIGKVEARSQLGLNLNAKIILLTSGGIGGGPIVDTAKQLSELGVEMIVVCGRHEGKLAELIALKLPGTTIHGQVPNDQMALLMQACDFMVAKPGGITTCEALSVGCPFLVYEPLMIPGQEKGNGDFLVDCGAGLLAKNLEQLMQIALQLLDHPEQLSAMHEAGVKHAQRHSAEMILDSLQSMSR